MPLFKALLAAALLVPVLAASGASPGRSLAQYTHQRWSEESDAPRPVTAIAQDKRGFLWIAGAGGLFRFDGLRFEQMSRGVDLVANGSPSALLVRQNGEVWTNFERSKRFAVYRDGQLRFLPGPPAPDRVHVMREARDGTVWALTEGMGRPLLRYRDGHWTRYWSNAGAPLDNPFSMVVTSDGVVWISFTGSVARLVPGSSRFEFVQRNPKALGRLSIDPQERIWLTERGGSYPITGPRGRGKPPPLRHAYATDAGEIRGWPTFDRAGNLWIATYYGGLQRVAGADPRGAASPHEAASRVEHFTSRDGLTSNLTTQIFEDDEGNIWAGTEGGLDRFSPAAIRFEPMLTDTAAFGDLLLQGSDGTVYIGEASTVYRVLPGRTPEPILKTRVQPRTMCQAPDGAIWIGIGKQVVIWRDHRTRRLGQPAPVDMTIYDCAFDANGDYWVTASLGGMARYRAGRWQRMFGPANGNFAPKSMVADERQRLIVQWNDRTLSRLGDGARTSVGIPFNSYKPEAVALYPAGPGTLYAAGQFGLARFRNGRFDTISARQAPLFDGVNGMVLAPGGDMWLAAPAGILRISSQELERAFTDAGRTSSMQVFGAMDGLKSHPHDHSRHSIVRGGDGRLWIATQSGTLSLDPKGIGGKSRPPKVWVTSLTATKVYRDPSTIELAAGTQNIQIDFAVLNFSNPRGVRVRYKVDGVDPDWIDAGTRRQAFYTNLAPGDYRFRLIAANEDGLWNETGASADFSIPPTFLQSRWFLVLCLLLAGGLLWLAYRLRMANVEGRMRRQLAARLGERERIARELHDTLLQSVQGLILRFQTVANRMSADERSKAHLEEALKRADEVFAEGRDRVQDLRLAEGASNFAELLRERAAEAGFDPAFPVRIVVEGRARRMHPIVSAELARIVGEALFNIARHARANSAEITVRYSARQLALEIRDDGIGFSAEVLEKGQKPGHFGLVGMRERAERIGGTFAIETRPGRGSAVTISVPARFAFADRPRRSLLSKFFSRTGSRNG
jgi:signal transduction histidine kinase/ligand-binding sensor domain-containing protein